MKTLKVRMWSKTNARLPSVFWKESTFPGPKPGGNHLAVTGSVLTQHEVKQRCILWAWSLSKDHSPSQHITTNTQIEQLRLHLHHFNAGRSHIIIYSITCLALRPNKCTLQVYIPNHRTQPQKHNSSHSQALLPARILPFTFLQFPFLRQQAVPWGPVFTLKVQSSALIRQTTNKCKHFSRPFLQNVRADTAPHWLNPPAIPSYHSEPPRCGYSKQL